jgi:hypothetical protein
MIVTEQDRIAARQEREGHRHKMSSVAAQRMRHRAEQLDRALKAEEQFLKKFNQLERDSWTMRQLLERISRPAAEASMTKAEIDEYHDRRTLKLRRCLAKGWKPNHIHDIVFFAELTPAEAEMSTDNFYEAMTANWPEAQVKVGSPEAEKKAPSKECALRSRCCRSFRRHGHPVSGRANYCSDACRTRALQLAHPAPTQ